MRYLPLTENERRAMLQKIGVASVDDLYCDVPSDCLLKDTVDLPDHQGELEVDRYMRGLSDKNMAAGSVPFFVGAGAYRHHVPATVDHLIQRGEFLTSYTPYQPEITQGTLQAIFEFQTQVAMITGMEVANASLYDGSTACVEAVMMANRVTKRTKPVLSGGLHPQYRDIVLTHAHYTGFDVNALPADPHNQENLIDQINDDVSCVVVQYPDFYGHIEDYSTLAKACHDKGALLVVITTEFLSLGALKSPGAMGADIFAGEGQSIGNGLNFGGPYVGLFATQEKFIRQMPGRLCGATVDADGAPGFVLTLSTREQHIRRERATSNICTNAGLCALAFTIHMSLLGETGFTKLAAINHAKAVQLVEKLSGIKGVEVVNDRFFNEFTLKLSKPANDVVNKLVDEKILGGVPVSRLEPTDKNLENYLLVAVTETTTEQDMDQLVAGLKKVAS